MTGELAYASATELAGRIRRGDLSPVEVVDAHYRRIEERNDRTNAYVYLAEEEARRAAAEREAAVESGESVGPLCGVPVAVKDLNDVAGMPTTYGAKPFAGNVAERDDAFVGRLRDAGAVVLGKTNTPEFGMSAVTDNLLFGPTTTPFAPDLTAGGSSGGSAAAVADGTAPIASASDGGGSIRIPAAFCGVYGIKPTFGRVPMDGRPDGFSRHTPMIDLGPLARTVEDAALMLDVMAGPHPRDPLSLPDDGTDYLAATRRSIDGLEIAYSPDLDVFPVEGEVAATVDDAAGAFERAGATVEPVEVGFERSTADLLAAWRTGMVVLGAKQAEAMRERGIDLLGEHRGEVQEPIVEERIEPGYDYSGVEYLLANRERTAVFDAIQDVFEEYDLLVAPTLTVTPFETGIPGPEEVDGVGINRFYDWRPTYLFNLTGHPAASVPAGFVDGLPVGLQIVGPRFGDDRVLAASAAFERVRPWGDAYDRL